MYQDDVYLKELYGLNECSVSLPKINKRKLLQVTGSTNMTRQAQEEDIGLTKRKTMNKLLSKTPVDSKKKKSVNFEQNKKIKCKLDDKDVTIEHNSSTQDTSLENSTAEMSTSFLSQSRIKESGKDFSGIQSFYEYASQSESKNLCPSPIPLFQSDICERANNDENSTSMQIWRFAEKAPSLKEVSKNLEKAGIYETRPIEKSVTYSSRDDAAKSEGISVGRQKIKVEWERRVPAFKSKVLQNLHPCKRLIVNECDESALLSQILVLQCTGRPPSSKKVAQDCKNKYSPRKEHKIPTLLNTEEDPITTKEFKLRVRKVSGNGSDSSCCTISQYSKTSQESDISNKDADSEDLFDTTTTSCRTPDRKVETTDIESPSQDKCEAMTNHSPSCPQVFVKYDEINSYNSTRFLKAEDMDSQNSLLSDHVTAKLNVEQCKDKGITLSEHKQEGENPYSKFENLVPLTEPISDSPNVSVQNLQNVKSKTTGINENLQFITVMSMECYVQTRQKLLPDPEFDAVEAVFYSIENDRPKANPIAGDEHKSSKKTTTGAIIVDSLLQCTIGSKNNMLSKAAASYVNDVSVVETEECLYAAFIETILLHDPDFLVGYDTETHSYGYLVRRAAVKGINLALLISRTPDAGYKKRFETSGTEEELSITGRIVINVWGIMRSEVSALTSFTFENVCYQILKERHPYFSHCNLTKWWVETSYLNRWRVIDFYTIRVRGSLKLLNHLDVIGKTSEMARLFGIQFIEVITRGSQFRVESILLRLSKARNFIPVSPSVKQRAQMRAPEYIPLVMEPESRFYGKNDPVIVLDFQSLYPSIIMAYNYCYSTCLGRVVQEGQEGGIVSSTDCEPVPYKFGCNRLKISPKRLSLLQGKLNFSPGGIAFLKAEERKGIIPTMLEEIIKTRLMVKRSMKLYEKIVKYGSNCDEIKAIIRVNDSLQKVLHARQLGLKLIANVTYGYTSANFSGRMPCIEVGDSVVSKGRETLERAIRYIKTNSSSTKRKEWGGCRVVYGDTDSIFVVLPGRTIKEAFDIGQQMAQDITRDNPKPVKLKFEKVYRPCLLQTKKRYVGYMYEHADQHEPIFDAKGIETVRRDGIPLSAKILEKSLKILFESEDMSLVKKFVQRQFSRIMIGRTALQDLTFAREFRGLSGYKPGACVPSLEITRRAMRNDRMAVPPAGWRVPYVIVYGEPGSALINSVRQPDQVLFDAHETITLIPGMSSLPVSVDSTLRPNDLYYITKVVIPVLSRCFSLVGVDINQWYGEIPKPVRNNHYSSSLNRQGVMNLRTRSVKTHGHQGIIPQYFANRRCKGCEFAVLNNTKEAELCATCMENPQKTVLSLTKKISKCDKTKRELRDLCLYCANKTVLCQSLDCPVLYARLSSESEVGLLRPLAEILQTKF